MQAENDSESLKHSDYLDFELTIDHGTGPEYPLFVTRSPAGEAHETMHFPFDELALESRLDKLEIALLRSSVNRRRILSPEEQATQDFGRDLFDALFIGEVRSRFDVSYREATQQGKGLRLKLCIRSPELAVLPWEFLYDPRQSEFISLSRNTPIIRYMELSRPIQPLTVNLPLRILVMVASPKDQCQVDVKREKQRLERATKALRAQGVVELTWLMGQTWRDLQRAIRHGPWHVFHFIGHGGFDRNHDEGFIVLADGEGMTHCLTATQLARLLADHSTLRLVLLNSCEGARGSKLDTVSSTAATLIRRGIPALLAMQYEITDRAAVEFASTFYEALSDGMPVDAAVIEARIAVSLATSHTVEWGVPVLYMRATDGKLFELTQAPVQTIAQRTEESTEVPSQMTSQPTEEPTQASVQAASQPIGESTEAPGQTTSQPTEEPTQAPVQATSQPTEELTQTPVQTTYQRAEEPAQPRTKSFHAKLSGTISIRTIGGVATPLLYKGTDLPTRACETFSTAEDNQSAVTIHLVLGENKSVANNVSLGEFTFSGVSPAARGVPEIDVTVRVDADSQLTVSATERTSGRSSDLGSVDLSNIAPPPVKDPLPLRGTISIETIGGVATPLLYKGTDLPTRACKTFSTAEDNQSAVTIHLVLGENKSVANNVSLGKFTYSGVSPAARGVPEIDVTVRVDTDSQLTVSATERTSGRSNDLGSVDLSNIAPPPVKDPLPQKISEKEYPLGSGSFSDLFSQLFGEKRAMQTPPGPTHGADIRYDLKIELEEALFGTEKKIVVRRHETCPRCRGSGAEPGTQRGRCPECKGTGKDRLETIFGSLPEMTTCPRCQGTGEIVNHPCTGCEGRKVVEVERAILLKVPPGVDTGTRIRLKDEGEADAHGGAAGHLYVVIEVLEHPVFMRNDLNLYLSLPISIKYATTGGDVRIPEPEKGKFSIYNIPPGTRSGHTFRIEGKGVRSLSQSGRKKTCGDLIVTLETFHPRNMSADLKKKLREIRQQMKGHDIEVR